MKCHISRTHPFKGSEVTQQVVTAGGVYSYSRNYSYDNIGQLKTAQGLESDQTTPRLQEQFGYAYDKAWNLSARTNNALIQSFTVNNVNELSGASQAGTLTVGGTAGEPNGNVASPGVTSVMVNGQSASLYEDGSFAATGFTPANGQNTYTAIAQDNVPQLSTNSVTVNVLGGASYTYDSNGNLFVASANFGANSGTMSPSPHAKSLVTDSLRPVAGDRFRETGDGSGVIHSV
jgi:hypothetical protein